MEAPMMDFADVVVVYVALAILGSVGLILYGLAKGLQIVLRECEQERLDLARDSSRCGLHTR
jgi:hypothetical protein